jgi:hypothetical protein
LANIRLLLPGPVAGKTGPVRAGTAPWFFSLAKKGGLGFTGRKLAVPDL